LGSLDTHFWDRSLNLPPPSPLNTTDTVQSPPAVMSGGTAVADFTTDPNTSVLFSLYRVPDFFSTRTTQFSGTSHAAGVVGTVPSGSALNWHDSSELGGGGGVVPRSLAAGPLGTAPSTGLKRSSAVCPTSLRARSGSFTPGSEMTTLVPWRVMSGSATP